MSNESSPRCPRCGAALLGSALAGLCPNCLMALNLAPETVLTGADAPVLSSAVPPPLSPSELAPHFPQLEILECLGRGGMGVVYKARQKSLNRLVALKLLAPERVSDAKFALRFTHEAQALATLNHPSIVTIYDFGQAGGFYFLLMEFVDGVNLRQAMKAGRFTPEQALAVVPPVCEALQYAHEHGIVHRDIKPENLLLDREGRVKIADFGIAKLLHAADPDVGLADSQPAGTPQYMAPEQREPHRTDHRADIYSLGVVLYELLTGELPADKLQPPSRKVQIDVRLDQIVLRALERTPELRYQTAGEFRTQLETVVASPVNSQPAQAEASSAPARLLKTGTSTITTPERLGTLPGPFLRGQLILDDRQLIHSRDGTNTIIPLAAIRDLSIGQYSRMVNPAGIDFVSVIYEEGGQRKQVLLSPMKGWFALPSIFNAHVAEWHAAIRDAVLAATGRAPASSQVEKMGVPIQSFGPLLALAVWLVPVGAVLMMFMRRHETSGGFPGAVGLFEVAVFAGCFSAVLLANWFLAGVKRSASPLAVFVLLHVCLFGCLLWSVRVLPESVASQFDGNGTVTTWMSRPVYLLLMGALPIFLGGILTFVGWLVKNLPPESIRIPRRDFWLTPERRAVFSALMMRRLLWLACLMTGFVGALHGIVVMANSSVPPHLSGRWMFGLVISFLLLVLLWIVRLMMVLAEPERLAREETASQSGNGSKTGGSFTARFAGVLMLLIPVLLLGFLVLRFLSQEALPSRLQLSSSGLAVPSSVSGVEVGNDSAVVRQRRYDGEGMMITFGTGTNRWTPGGLHLEAMFDVTLGWSTFGHGANWTVKARHGIYHSYRLDGSPGPMLGKIVFHPGTPTPAADGSYEIGEFRPEKGEPLPITVRLEKDNAKTAASLSQPQSTRHPTVVEFGRRIIPHFNAWMALASGTAVAVLVFGIVLRARKSRFGGKVIGAGLILLMLFSAVLLTLAELARNSSESLAQPLRPGGASGTSPFVFMPSPLELLMAIIVISGVVLWLRRRRATSSSSSPSGKSGTTSRVVLWTVGGLLLLFGVSLFNRNLRLTQDRQNSLKSELALRAALENSSPATNHTEAQLAESAQSSSDNSMTISLCPDGAIFSAGEKWTLEELKKSATSGNHLRSLVISADESVPFAQVSATAGALKASGLPNFSFADGRPGDGRFRVANRTGKYALGRGRDLYLCRPGERPHWFTVLWPAVDGKQRQQWSIYPKVDPGHRGQWAVVWEPSAEVLWWVDGVDVGRMRLTNADEVLVTRESRTAGFSRAFGLPEEVKAAFALLGFKLGAQQAAKPTRVFTPEEVVQEQPAHVVTVAFRVAEAYGISGSVPVGAEPSFGLAPLQDRDASPHFSVVIAGQLVKDAGPFGMDPINPGPFFKGHEVEVTGLVQRIPAPKENPAAKPSFGMTITNLENIRVIK